MDKDLRKKAEKIKVKLECDEYLLRKEMETRGRARKRRRGPYRKSSIQKQF